MGSEWVTRRIGDLGRVITGKTPSTRETGNFGGPYPFITIPDLDGRVFIDTTSRTLSEEGGTAISGSVLPAGAVLMSCIATVGKCGITTRPSFTNQQINAVVPGSEVDAVFLYYVFTQLGAALDAAGGGGSVYTNVSKSRFSDIEIRIPQGLPEQRAIAHILGTLDDKIENNRRMSATLEAMARALYQAWFVDFEPVRARMAGLPSASAPGDLSDMDLDILFPDRLVRSVLGDIPEGWSTATVGEVCTVVDCLHSRKPERRDSGLPLLQLNNIRDDGLVDLSEQYLISELDYAQWTSRIEASPGDCVITNVGRVGAVAQIPHGQTAALGRNMTGIRCRPEFPFPTFIIQCLLSAPMRLDIERNTDSGTILDSLNVRSIPTLRFVRPCDAVLVEFECEVRPLRELMETALLQSQSLMRVRDTLLPGLVSGEVRIADAHDFVEGAL